MQIYNFTHDGFLEVFSLTHQVITSWSSNTSILRIQYSLAAWYVIYYTLTEKNMEAKPVLFTGCIHNVMPYGVWLPQVPWFTKGYIFIIF